jgi:hypothetical protein
MLLAFSVSHPVIHGTQMEWLSKAGDLLDKVYAQTRPREWAQDAPLLLPLSTPALYAWPAKRRA